MVMKRWGAWLAVLLIALSAPLAMANDWKAKDKHKWHKWEASEKNHGRYDRDRFSWSDRGHTKYRGSDRNHDRVITRSEWRGSSRSFRRLDRNGDGVLSGREIREGERGRY